ncbi:MAG: 16S rRNA (cytosine(967)-C(5))-methyltransferase RsmB [Candidatus Eiseniibacteriota bacterium]|nr:MAG: 16S rRNA (cytosine(967)-C(5))-methyltransferase RsmB [Candidatus Eisenbacteria bacterium]
MGTARHRNRHRKKASARELAVSVLSAVDSRSAFSDPLISSYAARTQLSQQDRRLLTQLAKGTLRWRGRIDWVLSTVLDTELASLPTWIRNVLRVGAFQILFMDRIPVSAATDESVKLARQRGHPGTAGLVNAVLRKLAAVKDSIEYPSPEEDPVKSVAILYSHPEWIVRRWLYRFGLERTIRLCEANNSVEHFSVRPNSLKTTSEDLLNRLLGAGTRAERGRLNPEMLRVEGELAPATDDAFQAGLYTPQDEAESVVCGLLDASGAATFLDFCAAPGGKATQIAEATNDERAVWCLELHPARARQIEEAAGRLGLRSLRVVVGDGRSAPFRRRFQRILVDAPCSGLGVLGKRADARWRKKEESIALLSRLQRELLESASKLLEEEGVMVYSVCSFEPEETHDVVSLFLQEHPEFEVRKPEPIADGSLVDDSGAVLILPDLYGTDGVFAVSMRKAG